MTRRAGLALLAMAALHSGHAQGPRVRPASLATVQPAQAEAPRLKRASIAALEKAFDARILKVSATDPFEVMSSTQGVYLPGYGAVFTAQVDLIMTPTLNPFRQKMSPQDVARVRSRKVERLPVLKTMMKEMMMETAAALAAMPVGESVVMAVSLFHFDWENTEGMPAQIVMQASREKLLKRASADSAIQVNEF